MAALNWASKSCPFNNLPLALQDVSIAMVRMIIPILNAFFITCKDTLFFAIIMCLLYFIFI